MSLLRAFRAPSPAGSSPGGPSRRGIARRSLHAIGVLAAAALIATTACSTGNDPLSAQRESSPRGDQAAPSQQPSLSWAACEEGVAALAALECATLEVPLDVEDPDGESIELALARSAATGNDADRLGSLLLNPGGPGGSGIEFLANVSMAFPAELRERFDLVAFDPRGVGESSPVRCLDDAAKDSQLEGDLSPDTEEEVAEAVEEVTEFLRGCELQAGKMLEHMSTADVAADLDRIREAVGDDQLNYLGFSYGTAIGAVYATLFPDNVRAMVLDGSVSPDATVEERLLAQGQGFEGTLERFVEHCNAAEECALSPDAGSAISATRAALEENPVTVTTASGERTMGVDLFDLALATALYDTTVWGITADAIATIRDGGAAILFTLVDRQIGREPDGTYDNSTDARTMVNCADEDDRPDLAEARAIAERVESQLPNFGPALGWGALSCIGWPDAANPVPEIDTQGAPPILVVGTVGDPATPYAWSEEMAAALSESVLLTYEGAGHTAFLRGGSCVDDAVVAYLVDLELPDEGTRCPAQDEDISFGGLKEEVVSQFVEGGVPAPVAECVIDRIIAEVGEAEFTQMVLANDLDQLSRLVPRVALECSLPGG